MLPRVKFFLAIAVSLFVISLLLLTDVRVPAKNASPESSASPKPGTLSPLIAFRPYSKNVTSSNWLGVSAAEAADTPDIYADVYDSGSTRYDYDTLRRALTGKHGTDGDGEEVVFGKQVIVAFRSGTPPPAPSTDSSWPLYLTLEKPKACWHLDDSLSFNPDTSIEHKVLGKLIKSTTLPVCSLSAPAGPGT